jgi:hypothetical protein
MRRNVLIAVGLMALGVPEIAPAQTLTTPVFMAPYRGWKQNELGGYISDPGSGISIAIEGEYRRAQAKGQFDYGLQIGYFDASGNADNLFGVGADIRATVAKHNQSFPLDAAVTGGFGILFSSGNTGFLIPVGVTLGRQIQLEGSSLSFVPYVHPVIAPTFGDLLSDVQFGLGLGVDVILTPQVDVRVSGAVGDYEGVGIGVAWHR